jgi:peptidoglycan LD-endopeptidase LytH
MVIRHTIITTVILLFLLSLIPAEWKIIYRHIHSNKDYQPIIIPVSGTSHQAIENTYGASRPGGREHQGIDIFAPHGTPVLNAIDGIVLYTGRDTYGGNVVRILGFEIMEIQWLLPLKIRNVNPYNELMKAIDIQ